MESLNQFQKRQLIGQFYEKIGKKESHSLLCTLSKWDSKGVRIENNIPSKRSNGSGRKAIKINHKKIESLINSFDEKKGVHRKEKLKSII
jgi:hypothetical protein